MARAKQTLRWVWPLVALSAVAMLLLSFAQAFAQAPAGGFSGLGGDNAKKPIDIEYDRLEVDDKRHLAIFIGSVSATQGDTNLKAPRLEVTYESKSQAGPADKTAQAFKPVKPAKAPAAAPADNPISSSGQIKFIHALGGTVVLTNKKDQQEVTGEDAIYDVKAQKVTMTGKKVVLTQKGNIVQGKKLLIDLATGQATVIDERVKAVLKQEGGKSINPFGQPSKKEKEEAPPQPAASSPAWQTQSR
jgi:lipopolysaccharide export system protein LptA